MSIDRRNLIRAMVQSRIGKVSRSYYTKKWKRTNRLIHKSKGLCLHCSNPAIEGLSRCEGCRVAHKAQMRQRYLDRIAKGICQCKQLAEPGKTQCAACMQRYVESRRARRAAQKETGK